MKMLGKVLLGIAVLFAIAIGIGVFVGSSRYYYLAVANSGASPAQIAVAGKTETWTVDAHSAKTIKVEGLKDDAHEQKITVTVNGKPEVVTGQVKFGSTFGYTYILDVTGQSCLVAADYGALYQVKGADSAEEPALKVLKTYENTGGRFFVEPDLRNDKGDLLAVKGMLGEPLPDQISIPKGDTPSYVRWVMVPCELMKDGEGLTKFVLNN